MQAVVFGMRETAQLEIEGTHMTLKPVEQRGIVISIPDAVFERLVRIVRVAIFGIDQGFVKVSDGDLVHVFHHQRCQCSGRAIIGKDERQAIVCENIWGDCRERSIGLIATAKDWTVFNSTIPSRKQCLVERLRKIFNRIFLRRGRSFEEFRGCEDPGNVQRVYRQPWHSP